LTKCDAINLFLNSPQIDSNFSRPYIKKVDLFVIVDLDSVLTKCNCIQWRGKPVKLLTEGGLFDSVRRFNWPYLKVNKTNLFKFHMRDFEGNHGYIFIQGKGSLFSQADYIIRKKRYIIKKIFDGVE
jgi:hypothetical protein